MPRRKRNTSDAAELVWNMAWLILLGLFGTLPWLRSLAYVLIGAGVVVVIWRLVRYFKFTRPLNIAQVDEMSGPEFERFIAKLLAYQGYEVRRIGGLDDYGVDLIASRGGRKHAIQAKRWKQPVSIEAVRAAIAGMAYHHCDRAVVITSSHFTKPAKELAKGTQCLLIDRQQLALEIGKWQQAQKPSS